MCRLLLWLHVDISGEILFLCRLPLCTDWHGETLLLRRLPLCTDWHGETLLLRRLPLCTDWHGETLLLRRLPLCTDWHGETLLLCRLLVHTVLSGEMFEIGSPITVLPPRRLVMAGLCVGAGLFLDMFEDLYGETFLLCWLPLRIDQSGEMFESDSLSTHLLLRQLVMSLRLCAGLFLDTFKSNSSARLVRLTLSLHRAYLLDDMAK